MNNSDKIKENSKLNRYVDMECYECGKLIEGKWDSQVYLGMETGELDKSGIHRWLIYDKHIKCSPSRAQRIVHPKYPTIVDESPKNVWRQDDGPREDKMRMKIKKLYTDSWVSLQERYNPNWDAKLT